MLRDDNIVSASKGLDNNKNSEIYYILKNDKMKNVICFKFK